MSPVQLIPVNAANDSILIAPTMLWGGLPDARSHSYINTDVSAGNCKPQSQDGSARRIYPVSGESTHVSSTSGPCPWPDAAGGSPGTLSRTPQHTHHTGGRWRLGHAGWDHAVHAQRTRCHCPLETCPARRVSADAAAALATASLHGNIAGSICRGLTHSAQE